MQNDKLEHWIEREFRGLGVATRGREDPPHPDEPFMSMAAAKDLVRRAVTDAILALRPSIAGEGGSGETHTPSEEKQP
jgi:hypothetical protein